MTILRFDHDQVCCDLQGVLLPKIQEVYGVRIRRDQITHWDTLGPYIHLMANWPDIYDHILPLPGAVETVRDLVADGYRVEIVTAAERIHHDGKLSWFRRHMPFLAPDVVHMEKNKARFAEPDALLIDDAPHNIEAFRQAGGSTLIFDQPYNRDLGGPRVSDWWELNRWIRTNLAVPGSQVATYNGQ